MVSNRKTSTISDQKSKGHHAAAVGGKGALTSSGEGTSQVLIHSIITHFSETLSASTTLLVLYNQSDDSKTKPRRTSLTRHHNTSQDATSSVEDIAPLAAKLNSDEERELAEGESALGELRVREEKIGKSGRRTSAGGKMSSLSKRRSAAGRRSVAKKKPLEESQKVAAYLPPRVQ